LKIRFYIDPGTSQPHIYNHNVLENEVEEIIERPGEDRPGSDGARVAIGRTSNGRYLRVIYVLDEESSSIFIVTAYELQGKSLTAYKRRRGKKK
jgi:hypothetical protein